MFCLYRNGWVRCLGWIQRSGKAVLDACSGHDWSDLADPLSDILISFGFVFVQVLRQKVPGIVAMPFVINLVANVIFTPIQFGMRNLPLADVDILIVWSTIIWMMVVIWRHYKWVALAQVPYFVWVSLATFLQLSIAAMNWGRP